MPTKRAAAPAAAPTDAVTVTSENFGDLLIASLEEAVAIDRGALAPARAVTRERTARDTAVPPPRTFGKADVRAVRDRLRVSQAVFAQMVGVSVKLEQAWETGARAPNGAPARVLELIDRRPEAFDFLLAGGQIAVEVKRGSRPRGGGSRDVRTVGVRKAPAKSAGTTARKTTAKRGRPAAR